MGHNIVLASATLIFGLLIHRNPVVDGIVSMAPPIPMGLFISIATWWQFGDVNKLKEELNYICQNHRVANGQNQVIKTLVITEIAKVDEAANKWAIPPQANDELLWSPLIEATLPYFPGGNGPCQFDKVYVGAFAMNSPPNMDMASGGLRNSTYRTHLLARQKAMAQQFATKVAQSALPGIQWDWYIMTEMCMDYVIYDYYDPTLKSTEAWAEFFGQSMLDMNAVKPGRSFLISPMFQFHTSYYPTGSFGDNFMRDRWRAMFSQIQQKVAPTITACASAATCPFALDLQDHVGLAGDTAINFTREVASEQFMRLKSAFPFGNRLSMNVEQFIHSGWDEVPVNAYTGADCQEVREREQYYAAQGIALGNAWCSGPWYTCNHPGDPGVCETGWTRFNEQCYKKYAQFQTWSGANGICQSSKAQLASIHSKAENDFVVALNRPPQNVSIWVGLANPFVYTTSTYFGTKNGSILFRWSDKSPVDYQNWTPGWPGPLSNANGEYKCGAIYTANGGGQWGNAGCSWYADAFVCKKAALSRISIKAVANNKTVSAWSAGVDALQARSDWAYSWEQFAISENTDGTVSFKSLINSKYVSADLSLGAKLVANKAAIGTSEKFKLVYNSDGTVSLQAMANNKWVSAIVNYTGGTESVPLIANKDTATASSERFWLTNV